ncbi:MAG TPA: signal peptidase I [Candidatus Limnocylindrales bacterium]|nr:signal peptidase I [Candidatus Limnocylindrales bacterium]
MATEGPRPAGASLLRRLVIGRNPKRTLMRTAIWALACIVIAKFILLPIKVQGISMAPTYKANQVNFINRLAYSFHPPRRGDVVAIKLAGTHVMYLKRIVGLPGETVAFTKGRLLINGEVLPEPYLAYGCNWEHEPELVGQDEYYVVGDNRSMDFFDHEQGRTTRERIVGKIVL